MKQHYIVFEIDGVKVWNKTLITLEKLGEWHWCRGTSSKPPTYNLNDEQKYLILDLDDKRLYSISYITFELVKEIICLIKVL